MDNTDNFRKSKSRSYSCCFAVDSIDMAELVSTTIIPNEISRATSYNANIFFLGTVAIGKIRAVQKSSKISDS